MAVKKKPKSVSVTPTSTYRVPAASTVISKSKATGGTTVSHSESLRHDLRPSSYMGIASPPTSVAEKAAAKDYNQRGIDTGVQKGAEEFSKAQETYMSIAQKADLQNRLARGELPTSVDPVLQRTLEPSATSGVSSPERSGVANFFAPYADVGAERRQSAFGTESKTTATGIIAGAAAALYFTGGAIAPFLAARLSTITSPAASTAARVGTRGIVAKAASGTTSKWAANTATKKLATNWFQKLFSSSKVVTTQGATGAAQSQLITTTPTNINVGKLLTGLLITELTTVPWAAHLHSDNVIGSLSILARDARKAGDEQGVIEAKEALYEATNPSLWDTVLAFTAGVNVYVESKKIARAAQLTLQSLDRQDQMIQDKLANPEETYDEARARRKVEDDIRDEKQRLFNEAYYRDIDEQKAKAKAEGRKEDEEYYDKVLNREKKSDGTERFFK